MNPIHPEPADTPHVRTVREFEALTVQHDEIVRDGKLDIYPALHRKGYVEVRVGTERTEIQARGHVGLIPINDRLTLEVLPRVPIANLSHLLRVSGESPIALTHAVRTYETEGQMYPSLAGVYATALRQAVEAIVSLGLLKEYHRQEEVTSFPRGRILVGATIQRGLARGATHRAAISYFQRTVDNPANRCLLYAAWWLSQYVDRIESQLSRRQLQRIRRDLNFVWHALPGVTLDSSESFLDDSFVTGQHSLPTLRAYYRPALDLALVVIGRDAVLVEKSGGVVRLPSLVVSMSDVFEAYVRAVLVAAATSRGWTTSVLNGNLEPPNGGAGLLLRGGLGAKATPDIVFRRIAPPLTCPLLVEVKYKPAADRPSRDDLNQSISYGAAYSSPTVVVAQPSGTAARPSPLAYLGEVAGMRVYQYAMNLAADLASEEHQLASELEGVAALT